jgi:O-antigen ligase
MTHNLRLALVPAYLMLCLVLGGASAAGFWVNLLLQLLALPIIIWALLARRSTPMPAAGRQLCLILALMLLVIIVQLIPLPPSLWTTLPGREPIAAGFRLLGQPLPWLPISLAPHETPASALWLLPAIAVTLGIVRLGAFKPKWIAWVIAVFTTVSVGLGALQISGGDPTNWYFYRITNVGFTTGFFANANHMATLLVCTVPFLTALYLNARSRGQSAQTSSGMFVILAGAMTVVVVGVVINTSLAGIGLSIPVVAASILMLISRRKRLPGWSGLVVAALAALAVAIAFSAPFENNLTGTEAKASQESRYTSFTKSLDAARDYMPVGSGIGTFSYIYRMYEDPTGVTQVFMNHVHSDYIEIALETGLLGLAVVLVFLSWWLARTIAIWRSEEPDHFARAATIASAVILAHSLVDYPLRTAAISALFAACCGLLCDPRSYKGVRKKALREDQARHLSAD